MADGREAKLIPGNRSRVVWVGRQIPDELRYVVEVLGLSVEALRNLDRLDPRAADLFAVLVSAQDEDEHKALGRLLRLSKTMHVLDYGVLLGVASLDPQKAYALQGDVRARTQLQIAALGLRAMSSHGPCALTNQVRRLTQGSLRPWTGTAKITIRLRTMNSTRSCSSEHLTDSCDCP